MPFQTILIGDPPLNCLFRTARHLKILSQISSSSARAKGDAQRARAGSGKHVGADGDTPRRREERDARGPDRTNASVARRSPSQRALGEGPTVSPAQSRATHFARSRSS
eukprot:31284-Pelagococcus_subviridis.AAC.3